MRFVRSSVDTTSSWFCKSPRQLPPSRWKLRATWLKTDPTFHTDVDRDLFIKVPLESQSSTLSSLVTLTTPGVAADSNGLFHGLGDHASNSFSVDGQSITDQQSKVFSNQLPSNSIQSIEVISGAPPAEYGGKTSLVIVATTRSGQGVTKPTGSINSSYGSFGSATVGFDLSYGGKNWGNFVEADGLNTGRFLDPPEFTVFHDKGNRAERLRSRGLYFTAGRLDPPGLQLQPVLVPDAQLVRQPERAERGQRRHQRQPRLRKRGQHRPALARSAPSISRRLIRALSATTRSSTSALLSAETTITTIQATIRWPTWDRPTCKPPRSAQNRTLTNAGVHSDFSYSKGIHNIKIGAQYGQTFLRENDSLGVVDRPTASAPCVDAERQSPCRVTPVHLIARREIPTSARILTTSRLSRPTT